VAGVISVGPRHHEQLHRLGKTHENPSHFYPAAGEGATPTASWKYWMKAAIWPRFSAMEGFQLSPEPGIPGRHHPGLGPIHEGLVVAEHLGQ